MPVVQASDIGPKYDILIATRDGSTLSCVDRNKTARQLSQVAYVMSTDPQHGFHEATEIQRKDRLTELTSAQVTDRDFDAWPQVQQGDWSDGLGQRVFSGQGEALGTVANRSTKYWDGLGVLWPVNDYIPSQAVLADLDQHESGGRMINDQVGTASGQLASFVAGSNVFAYVYMQQATPNNHILVVQGPVGSQTTLTNPFGLVANTQPAGGQFDYLIAYGSVFATNITAGPNQVLYQWPGSGGVNTWDTITGGAAMTSGAGQFNRATSLLAAGVAGNRSYFAMARRNGPVTSSLIVRLYDLTQAPTIPITTFVDIPIGNLNANPIAGFLAIEQMEFSGDNLMVAASDNTRSYIIQYNIPSQTSSVVARFEQVTDLYMCAVAGGMFIVSANNPTVNNIPASADMWLLQGSTLQHLGPIYIPEPSGQGAALTGFTNPQVYGPYAIFSTVYNNQAQVAGSQVTTYAYDVLRGRLFRMANLTGADVFLNLNYGRRQAVLGPCTHNLSASSTQAQWAVCVNLLSTQGNADDVSNVRRLMMQVAPTGGSNFIVQPVNITSSLVDFTSAQNKLYRQVVASFTQLGTDPSQTVTLNVWIDQDPSSLNAAPDLTTTIAGSTPNSGTKQLKLPLNRVARKLVYQVITTMNPTGVPGAVKLQSVAVQSATGWSIHMFLAMSNRAMTNNGNESCFNSQATGVDELSAYNFVRQVWRQKGGECTITLPNGDSYSALIQLIDGSSPKPFGSSFSSNLPNSYQEVVELKLREDI